MIVPRYSGRRTVQPVLGLDIGGVLVDRLAEGEDTSFFGSRPMETPAVDGAGEAVERLLAAFDCRVHIVSKAGPRIATLSRQWLAEQEMLPGPLLESQVHFVRDRADKAPICRRLGVTHFVDDRLSVLNHLADVDRRVLFTGGLGVHPAPPMGSVPVSVAMEKSPLVAM
ncbi:hypothetical protein [Nostocoides veronense]|uniref:hypothetical protein n=1 Tax=Nostocoides veronense TaxID=330836 RepID=UPI0031E242BE